MYSDIVSGSINIFRYILMNSKYILIIKYELRQIARFSKILNKTFDACFALRENAFSVF